MIPLTKKRLEKLIEKRQKAGINVTDLKNILQNLPIKTKMDGHVEKIKDGDRETTYLSTGFIHKEYFKNKEGE